MIERKTDTEQEDRKRPKIKEEIGTLGDKTIDMIIGAKAKKLGNSSNMQKTPTMMSKEEITKAISETKVESRTIAEIAGMDQITHIKDTAMMIVIETMEVLTHQVVVAEAMAAAVEATPIVAADSMRQ